MRSRWLLVVLLVAALIAGGGAAVWARHVSAPHEAQAGAEQVPAGAEHVPSDDAEARGTDMRGAAVRLDPGEVPISVQESQAVASTGGDRFVVSSVGLDVPLGALNAVDGQITPPGFTSAYRVRNAGVPVSDASRGTVFIVAHSLRHGGLAPGNYLTDVAHQRSAVSDGAAITVAGVDYRVTDSQVVAKTQIASDTTVWANTPNRLVVITCLERADGSPSTQNLVIVAMRAKP